MYEALRELYEAYGDEGEASANVLDLARRIDEVYRGVRSNGNPTADGESSN